MAADILQVYFTGTSKPEQSMVHNSNPVTMKEQWQLF
jgi:hypothetical protein